MFKLGVGVAVLMSLLTVEAEAAEVAVIGKEFGSAKMRPVRVRTHHVVRPFAYVPPAPTVEVQPWSDGLLEVSGWCFIPDADFAGLGAWRGCGVY
ncbi:hypothetical protein ACVIGB_000657 [Bradyrhizobium sp. USDA 4341]